MILEGKPVSEKIYSELRKKIHDENLKPNLGVILVGERRESLSYIKAKEKIAASLGIGFKLYQFSELTTEDLILNKIQELNDDRRISGIVLQLPLPININTEKIIDNIDPKKDVDGIKSNAISPAAQAVIEIVDYYHLNLEKVVLLGRGRLVGKPLEKLLTERNIKPVICTRETKNLDEIIRSGKIIITAIGNNKIITKDNINSEQIIIDAGTLEDNGTISGDLDKNLYDEVDSYTPVPGGVGPVTVACLMKNLIEAEEKK